MMRDPTRGGVAATLNEIAARQRHRHRDRRARRARCPTTCARPAASSASIRCTSPTRARSWRSCAADGRRARTGDHARRTSSAAGATLIGTVIAEHPGVVVARTGIGGTRVVDLPLAEQLPRIC